MIMKRKIRFIVALTGLIILAGTPLVSAQTQRRTITNTGSERVETGNNTKVGNNARCVITSTQNGVVNTQTNECPGGSSGDSQEQLSPDQLKRVNQLRSDYSQELSRDTQNRVAELLSKYRGNSQADNTGGDTPNQSGNPPAAVTIPAIPQDRCEAIKTRLEDRYSFIQTKADQHKQRFDDVTAKIEAYVASQELPAEAVDQLMLGVSEARNKADISIGALASIDTDVNCDRASDAAGNALAFRAVTESVGGDLRDYQNNIKRLIEQLKNR